MLPLTDTTILVTRAVAQSQRFTALLQAQGATVLALPALSITPPSCWTALDAALAQLQTFTWLVFTSANGVESCLQRLATARPLVPALAGIKIAVVGRQTANCLRQYGVQPTFMPTAFTAEALVAQFPAHTSLEGTKILYPHLENGGRTDWVAALTALGAHITAVPAYQSRCPDHLPGEALTALQQGAIAVVTFASPKTVHHFRHLLEREGFAAKALLQTVCLAALGPQTALVCQTVLGRVDVQPTEYTSEGLTQALTVWRSSRKV